MSKRPTTEGVVGEGRWLWPSFALPGVVWLIVLFLTPLYAILAVAMGTPDPIFGDTLPVWNPLRWNPATFGEVLNELFTGQLGVVFLRTLVYVAVATASEPPDRVPGRLLRRPSRGTLPRACSSCSSSPRSGSTI